MPAHSDLASLRQAPVSSADAEHGSNNMAVRKRELCRNASGHVNLLFVFMHFSSAQHWRNNARLNGEA